MNANTEEVKDPDIPKGRHPAILYLLVDLGRHVSTWQGKEKTQRKVRLGWEFPTLLRKFKNDDGEEVELPLVVSEVYTVSTGAKSKLRPLLESWDNEPMVGDYPDYDLDSLMGRACELQMVWKEDKNGRKHANVLNVLSPGDKEYDITNEPVYYSFAAGEDLPAILAEGGRLHWIVTSKYCGMQDSLEYKALHGEPSAPISDDEANAGPKTEDDGSQLPF